MNTAEKSIDLNVRHTLGGTFSVRPMNITKRAADGTPLEWEPAAEWAETRNLILPAGKSYQKSWMNHMRREALPYYHCGTGTTPNKVTLSGTFQQAATTVSRVTGSGVFASGNVGDFIKFATGEIAKIVTFTNTLTVEVDRSQTVAAAALTVYDTSRVNLDSWSKSTNTSDVAAGANGFTEEFDLGVSTRWETYNFAAEVAPATYTEIGVAAGSTSGSQLFSRVLLDSPVNVNIGQFLQVKYTLRMTVGNYRTSAPYTVSITGWPRPYSIQSITPGAAGGTAFDILLTEAVNGHYAVGRPIIVTGALPPTTTVTSISSTSSDFTVTATAHGRIAGESIVLAGTSNAAYHGTWTIASVTTNTITVTSASNPGAATGGTVRLATPGTWYDGTWTIASFPTANTIRVTNNTITVPAGAVGTVKNNTNASAIMAGRAFNVTTHTGSANEGYRGCMDSCNTQGAQITFHLKIESAMATGMVFGVDTIVSTGGSSLVQKSPVVVHDTLNRKSTYTATILSGEAISQTIRQIAVSFNYGVFWITFEERQRKDNGYQLVVAMTESWEPELL